MTAALSLVHPCDISRYVLLFGAAPASSAETLSEQELQSLLSPGGTGARDINVPLVAGSLANGAGLSVKGTGGDFPATFSVQSPIRELWNGAAAGFKQAKDTLSISDPSLWTGELFRGVPHTGADLIAVQVDDDAKRVLIVLIGVSLGNEPSVITADAKTPTTAAERAYVQIRDSHRNAKAVEANVSAAAAAAHAGYAVEQRHALAAVRRVLAATAEVFSANGVSLWDRSTMAHRWLPAAASGTRSSSTTAQPRKQPQQRVPPAAPVVPVRKKEVTFGCAQATYSPRRVTVEPR